MNEISPEEKVESLMEAWRFLVNVTKHRSRYFFHSIPIQDRKKRTPLKVLEMIRRLSCSAPLNLLQPHKKGSILYRARHYDGTWRIDRSDELLAPPPRIAPTGRMNPAGISYLYLAEQENTALAEVRPKIDCEFVVAEFWLKKDLHLLDLTDVKPREGDSPLTKLVKNFLTEFVEAITAPVSLDGTEHIDYVPSQIVCEYFAQSHLVSEEPGEPTWEQRIDGIRYPSAVQDVGVNVVLFPTWPDLAEDEPGFKHCIERTDRMLKFHAFNTWEQIASLILSPARGDAQSFRYELT